MSRAPRDTEWDAIVVGAGLGGLTAGAALSRSGRRVLVLEQHDVPGGYAHRFLRRPRGSRVVYHFDVALHQIGGLAADRRLSRSLSALGVLDRIRLRSFPVLYRTRGPDHDLAVATDVDEYRRQLTALFPRHAAGIAALLSALAECDLGVSGFADPPTRALRWLGRTLADVLAEHVPDERFIALFSPLWAYLGLPPAELCAFTFAQVWASYHLGGAWYIEGGGQALSDALVATIEAQPGRGQVLLREPVERILTSGGHVVGVQTRRHGRLSAPVVISNASAPQTFEQLLDDRRLALPERRQSAELPSSVSIVECYLGIRGRAEELGLPDRLTVETPDYDLQSQWAAVQRGDPRGVAVIIANHNLSDPASVPAGRSVLNVAALCSGASWLGLPDDEYRRRKRAIEAELVAMLSARIPDLGDRLEICETGTPHTMARYSWNPAGAIYGIPASPRSHPLRRPGPRTSVPGLYLAGAWTFPAGGFHGALTSGLNTADLVSADLGSRRFVRAAVSSRHGIQG